MEKDLKKLYEKYSADERSLPNRDEVARLYDALTPENRDLVNRMIEFLSDRQSGDPQ